MEDKISWFDWKATENHKRSILDTLDSGWISGGEQIEKCTTILEKTFDRYPLLVSNGTVAIDVSFWSLNLKPGDEVLLPDYGFLAAFNSAKRLNLKVKLYRICEKSLCPDIQDLKNIISRNTKCVVLIYNYGLANASIYDIISFLKTQKIPVIEDIAEGVYSRIKGQLLGTLGDISTCSFHATKTITSGEGGMLLFKKKEVRDRAALFISHGLERSKIDYNHLLIGTNFRLSNILAAILSVELEMVETTLQIKRNVRSRFERERFKNFEIIPSEKENELWALPFHYNGKLKKDELKNYFLNQKVETRMGFIPPYNLKLFKQEFNKTNKDLRFENIFLPPSHKYLKRTDLDKIINLMHECS